MDIVVTDEETPVQDILIEQLAKIVTASTRTLWTQARERSGILPSGRTLLGTLVDPLGLFQSSPLVNTCDQDEKIVETTRKLVALFGNQMSTSDGLVDLSNLQRDELLEFSSILARKVWDRRSALLKTGNRFATKLLQLTAFRLENGERVSRPIRDLPESNMVKIDSSSSSILASNKPVSSRLVAARNRLEELEQADMEEPSSVIVEDPIPVKNR